MKVTSSIRPICDHCKVIRKQGRVMIVCNGSRPHPENNYDN